MHPPPLLLHAEKKRSAVHGVGEEEGWGTDEDGPLLLQDGFVLCGKRMQVWCRLDLLQHPHPLARWLGARRSAVLVVQTCAPCFSFRCRSPGARESFAKPCEHRASGSGRGC